MPADESSVVGHTRSVGPAASGPACGLPWLRMALAAGLSCVASFAQEFRISRFSLAPNPTVEVEGDGGRYYILYRNGAVVDTGRQPSALGLGIPGRVVLEDRTAADSDAARFYRVEARPLTEALDLDGDGIDDVFELRNRSILDPLDRGDALRDPDADGLSNLDEYRNRTDPQLATVLTVPDAVPAEFASGQEHFVALRNGGTLWTWGYNRYGQLGVGWAGVSNVFAPVQVAPGRTWKTVAAGAHHTMAITSEGRLYGWGRNGSGQLGDTTTQDRFEPVAVAPDRRWIQVCAGDLHTLALDEEGFLFAWGANSNGQVGDGTKQSRSAPVQVGDARWRHIQAAGQSSSAVRSDGTLWHWGTQQLNADTNSLVPRPLGNRTDWVQASALRRDGRFTPVPWSRPFAGTPTSWDSYAALTNRSLVEAAVRSGSDDNRIALAVDRAGGLWAAGRCSFGEVHSGLYGTADETRKPGVNMETFYRIQPGRRWLRVSVGSRHAMALAADGTLWTWRVMVAEPDVPQSDSHPVPVRVKSDLQWRSVSAGGLHSVGLAENGSMWVWGGNTAYPFPYYGGQLGDGTHTGRAEPRWIGGTFLQDLMRLPDGLPPGSWKSVHAAMRTSYFIDPSWKLWGAGTAFLPGTKLEAGMRREWGEWMSPPETRPLQWESVSPGLGHVLAIEAGGRLWANGDNSAGQIGDGTTVARTEAIRIEGNQPWQAAEAGFRFSVGVQMDGSMWTWGDRTYLGDNSAQNRLVPGRVGADRVWVQVSAGDGHAVALDQTGAVWAWGLNNFGQHGVGSRTTFRTLSRIDPVGACRSVAAGFRRSYAIDREGRLWAWGSNAMGALGDGTTEDRLVPVRIAPERRWRAVSSSKRGADGSLGGRWRGEHTLAIDEQGHLWAWGGNDLGQCGDGEASYLPRRVGSGVDWGLVRSGSSGSP